MGRFIKIFFIGLMISVLGTLPLGTLNIISMQLSVAEGYKNAILFALGAAIVEIVYVRISLVGMNWVLRHKSLFKWLDWIAVSIVAALAVANFIAAGKPHATHNAIISNHMNRFLSGLMLSAINPVQIPFWLGWSTVLFSKKILKANAKHYNFYITGIGTGTLAGLAVFIFGGQLFATTLDRNSYTVSLIVGSVFSVAAIIQVVKIVRHKGFADSL